jgi:hypothetical protein
MALARIMGDIQRNSSPKVGHDGQHVSGLDNDVADKFSRKPRGEVFSWLLQQQEEGGTNRLRSLFHAQKRHTGTICLRRFQPSSELLSRIALALLQPDAVPLPGDKQGKLGRVNPALSISYDF